MRAKNAKIKTISLFAGVGGIDLGFEKNGFNTVFANDIDNFACKTYGINFENELLCEDIKKIKTKDLPQFECLIGGFPCQAFSIAGYRKGFEDTRGTLFFEIARILKEKKPNIVFLENVKNLVSHDNGNTFKKIIETLEELKYYVKYKILNACEYGNIPQNRERIYIVGFLNKKHYDSFEFPEPIKLEKSLNDVIDFNKKVDDRFYYTKDKYPKIMKEMKNFNDNTTIYQWRRQYVRQNKNHLCPTLTANMGTGGHNVPLVITKYGVRKLTPKECFNLQGFPKDYKLPNIPTSQLYKQAGNSVCVTVVERIAKNIQKAIKK